jgi:hypothetical protein
VWGAVERTTNGNSIEAFEQVLKAAKLEGFDEAEFGERWNDAPDRTQAEAVSLLHQASALAREQGK